MKKHIILFTILFILNLSFYAQAQQNTFARVFYDTQQNGIQAKAIAATPDKGYIIAGTGPAINGIIIKTDSVGQLSWNKTYNLTNSNILINGMTATNDSGYMLFGTSYNTISSRNNALCIKINASGDTLWSETIGMNDFHINAVSLQQAADSGFIMTGYTENNTGPYSRIFTAKLNANGNLLWANVFSISNYSNIGYSVKPTPDNGCLIIGSYTDCTPCFSYAFLIKLSESGMHTWSKKYRQTSTDFCSGYDFLNTDSGYLCYLSSGLVQTDFSGNVLWTKSFAGMNGSECINCPQPKLRNTPNHGYALLSSGFFSGRMLTTDSEGNGVWAESLFLSGADVAVTSDDGFIIAGNGPLVGVKGPMVYSPQIGLIRVSATGVAPECIFPEQVNPITDTITASPVVFTMVSGGAIYKIHPDISSTDLTEYAGCVDFIGGMAENAQTMGISIFPNPASTIVNIESEKEFMEGMITVYNTSMQVMLQLPLRQKHTEIDISSFSSGLYFVKIASKKTVGAWKLLKN
jgi:hypothetical protein